MVDWASQKEIQRETAAYANVVFATFGLYVWEVFQTSDFEMSFFERKRKFKLRLVIPTFIARYLLILSISALMASFTVKSPIDCGALFTFISVSGNLSIICASVTLMLRTIAVWERTLPITVALGVLCLAHTALLFRGMFIMSAAYSPGSQACVISALTNTNRVFLSVTYWATLGFNLTLTVLHVVGLMKSEDGGSVWDLLFKKGVIYYLAASMFNAVPAVFSILNLNLIMNLITTVPAAAMTVVAGTRTVTRLPEVDDDDDVYVHSATQLTAARLPNATSIRFQNKVPRYPPRPEVHVTTDQIVMEDYEPSPSSVNDKTPSLTGDDKSTFDAV